MIDDWILNVDDDAQQTAEVWAQAVKNILADRTTAFKRAREYRSTFRDHFDWLASVRAFLDRITILKGNGNVAPV
jgi:hypothetical protein